MTLFGDPIRLYNKDRLEQDPDDHKNIKLKNNLKNFDFWYCIFPKGSLSY